VGRFRLERELRERSPNNREKERNFMEAILGDCVISVDPGRTTNAAGADDLRPTYHPGVPVLLVKGLRD
jgi:hypothetical protein